MKTKIKATKFIDTFNSMRNKMNDILVEIVRKHGEKQENGSILYTLPYSHAIELIPDEKDNPVDYAEITSLSIVCEESKYVLLNGRFINGDEFWKFGDDGSCTTNNLELEGLGRLVDNLTLGISQKEEN